MLKKSASEPSLVSVTELRVIKRTESESAINDLDYFLYSDRKEKELYCKVSIQSRGNNRPNYVEAEVGDMNGESLPESHQQAFVKMIDPVPICNSLPKSLSQRIREQFNIRTRETSAQREASFPYHTTKAKEFVVIYSEHGEHMCYECGAKFPNFSKLSRHFNTHCDSYYFCVLCNRQFRHDYNIIDHWKLYCPVLKNVNYRLKNYNAHELRVLVDYVNRKRCQERSIELIPPLKDFEAECAAPLTNIKEVNCQCPMCHLSIPSWHIRDHLARHEGHGSIDDRCQNRMYICDLCAELFQYHVDLCNHWRYRCPVVRGRTDDGLRNETFVAIHLRNLVHDIVRGTLNGRKGYKRNTFSTEYYDQVPAPVISAPIVRRRRLEAYSCSKCIRKFNTIVNLNYHELEFHNGIYSIRCYYCKNVFVNRHNVVAHWRTSCRPLHRFIPFEVLEMLSNRDLKAMCRIAEHTKVNLSNQHAKISMAQKLLNVTEIDYLLLGKVRDGRLKKFMCKMCDLSFKTLHTLRDHAKVAHDGEEFLQDEVLRDDMSANERAFLIRMKRREYIESQPPPSKKRKTKEVKASVEPGEDLDSVAGCSSSCVRPVPDNGNDRNQPMMVERGNQNEPGDIGEDQMEYEEIKEEIMDDLEEDPFLQAGDYVEEHENVEEQENNGEEQEEGGYEEGDREGQEDDEDESEDDEEEDEEEEEGEQYEDEQEPEYDEEEYEKEEVVMFETPRKPEALQMIEVNEDGEYDENPAPEEVPDLPRNKVELVGVCLRGQLKEALFFSGEHLCKGGIEVIPRSKIAQAIGFHGLWFGQIIRFEGRFNGQRDFVICPTSIYNVGYFLWPTNRIKEVTWDNGTEWRTFSQAFMGLDGNYHRAIYDDLLVTHEKTIREIRREVPRDEAKLEAAKTRLTHIKDMIRQHRTEIIKPNNDGKYHVPKYYEVLRFGQLVYLFSGVGTMSNPIHPDTRIVFMVPDIANIEMSCRDVIKGPYGLTPFPTHEVVVVDGSYNIPRFVKQSIATAMRMSYRPSEMRQPGQPVGIGALEAYNDPTVDAILEPVAVRRGERYHQNQMLRADSERNSPGAAPVARVATPPQVVRNRRVLNVMLHRRPNAPYDDLLAPPAPRPAPVIPARPVEEAIPADDED